MMAEETFEPPIVARSWLQPATGNKEVRSVLPKPQEIGFSAYKGSSEESFSALAGEGAPTLSGGWVKLAKIQRFQRTSVTLPEGYDPLVLTVPLLLVQKSGSNSVEDTILKLEWMAGRPAHAHEATGEPPYVEVYAVTKNITPSNLIPRQFQSIGGQAQEWYITQITYDPNPLRDKGGDRIRQLLTVELTEIILSPSAQAAAKGHRDSKTHKYRIYHTSSTVNTIRKVAVAEHHPSAWKAILEANRDKLGNHPDKALPKNTPVKVPETIFAQVPR